VDLKGLCALGESWNEMSHLLGKRVWVPMFICPDASLSLHITAYKVSLYYKTGLWLQQAHSGAFNLLRVARAASLNRV
jgi:hypothetical protein